jgi:hypothetical protein
LEYELGGGHGHRCEHHEENLELHVWDVKGIDGRGVVKPLVKQSAKEKSNVGEGGHKKLGRNPRLYITLACAVNN